MRPLAMDETKSKLRSFLRQHVRNPNIRDDDDIFSLGYVNSLFAMQLVMLIESEFGIEVENEDLELDNFRSITAICGFIRRKTGPPSRSDN